MNIRFLLPALMIAGSVFASGSARADEYKNKIRNEISQVRSGDYSYSVNNRGERIYGSDRVASQLRATRKSSGPRSSSSKVIVGKLGR